MTKLYNPNNTIIASDGNKILYKSDKPQYSFYWKYGFINRKLTK